MFQIDIIINNDFTVDAYWYTGKLPRRTLVDKKSYGNPDQCVDALLVSDNRNRVSAVHVDVNDPNIEIPANVRSRADRLVNRLRLNNFRIFKDYA